MMKKNLYCITARSDTSAWGLYVAQENIHQLICSRPPNSDDPHPEPDVLYNYCLQEYTFECEIEPYMCPLTYILYYIGRFVLSVALYEHFVHNPLFHYCHRSPYRFPDVFCLGILGTDEVFLFGNFFGRISF